MNYESIILFSVACLGFYIRIKYGLIIVIFWIISLLFNFFFTTVGINLSLNELNDSEIYYIAKKGNYNNLYPYLKEFKEIKQKFQLPSTYKPFGIFYDNPMKNKNKLDKLRSVIGIINHTSFDEEKNDDKNKTIQEKKKIKKEDFNANEFKKYMKSKYYKNITLPKCKGILGEYETFLHFMAGFLFIANIFINNINQKYFTRLYNPEWKDVNIKNARRHYNKKCGVLEILEIKKIQLFIPTDNEKGFNLYYE